MPHATSTVITSLPDKSHSDQEMQKALEKIHALGMRALVKCHVDVEDGTWRGEIRPSDPNAWFNSYTSFITTCARIASSRYSEGDFFSVGTELKSMSGSQYRTQWLEVIRRVREMYRGPLVYAANWDEYLGVSFWDHMDFAGIDAYFPLTGSGDRDPSVDRIVQGWQPWLQQIENWQRTQNKPVVFTEIGYGSYDYASWKPWCVCGGLGCPPCNLNTGLQARAYEAAFRAFLGKAWFQGMFWWLWEPVSDAGGLCDVSFTPQNKPAEAALRVWYGPSCRIIGTVRSVFGAYYLEEAGRVAAFLYGSVNFAPYLGQRVIVSGPCRPARDTFGPVPVFVAQSIQLWARTPRELGSGAGPPGMSKQ